MKDQNPHRDGASAGLPVELEAWLSEKPNDEVRALEEVWVLAAHAQLDDPAYMPDAERFGSVQEAVRASIKSSPRVSVRLATTQSLKWAASLLVLMIAGAIWWTRPIVIEAPRGERVEVQLLDGSEVALNSGSRLAYRRSFGSKNRAISLQGEAFFDVVHDEMPFKVETFNGSVTVLGTRFNVRSWKSDELPETVVVLEEGSVLLSGVSDDIVPVVLKPGELSRISGTGSAPSEPLPINIRHTLAWRTGGLMFVDQPIGVVIDEVQRRFDVSVQVSPRTLRQELMTLRLNEVQDAKEILELIAETRGYSLTQTGQQFTLSRP